MEFKNSPTSPLAGTLRLEIDEHSTVYFAEKDGQLEWAPELMDHAAFSLVNTEGQWHWLGLAADVSLEREGEAMPSGSFLSAGDQVKAGRFTVAAYPSEEKITALVFDPNTQRLKDFETLEQQDLVT